MLSPFLCSTVIRECSWKKTQIEKKVVNIKNMNVKVHICKYIANNFAGYLWLQICITYIPRNKKRSFARSWFTNEVVKADLRVSSGLSQMIPFRDLVTNWNYIAVGITPETLSMLYLRHVFSMLRLEHTIGKMKKLFSTKFTWE